MLFFLSCVVPSIWILCLDEASRKNKFNLVAGSQESKIKSFVLSLEDLISTPTTGLNNEVAMASIVNASTSHLKETSLKLTRALQDSFVAMPQMMDKEDVDQTTSDPATSSPQAQISKAKSRSKAEAKKFMQKNVDCCDVKVSYWFQEDNMQHLFMQSLMVILVASRWLITRAELNLNQRSLILVISISVAADICDFFNYISLEVVYSSSYMIYVLLLILSLSLLQFVFLHVEDSLNLTRSFTSSFTSTSNNESETNGSSNQAWVMQIDQFTHLYLALAISNSMYFIEKKQTDN